MLSFKKKVSWTSKGWMHKVGTITRDLVNNETFHVKCDGYCGGCAPKDFYIQVQPDRGLLHLNMYLKSIRNKVLHSPRSKLVTYRVLNLSLLEYFLYRL